MQENNDFTIKIDKLKNRIGAVSLKNSLIK
jgi:hypothetical protein